MISTQVPKTFGYILALVGIPLILWDAWGTSKAIDALEAGGSSEARRALCEDKLSAVPELTQGDAHDICRCVVNQADTRGIMDGERDQAEAALAPVIDACIHVHLAQ